MIKFKVRTWFDTITDESASNGDYESTGNDLTEKIFDNLEDALDHALDNLNCLQNEDDLVVFANTPKGSIVLYSADPVTDYESGDEDMHTSAIEVFEDESEGFGQ